MRLGKAERWLCIALHCLGPRLVGSGDALGNWNTDGSVELNTTEKAHLEIGNLWKSSSAISWRGLSSMEVNPD